MAKKKKPEIPVPRERRMFPEKDIIDLKSLDHLKFVNGTEIQNQKDLDTALGEINHLFGKRKETHEKIDRLMKEFSTKAFEVTSVINDKSGIIEKKVSDYINKYPDRIHFHTREDGNLEATLNLEHGSVVITRVTKTEIKIKPAKDPSPVTKKHKRQLEPA
jgi:hypothetical protein